LSAGANTIKGAWVRLPLLFDSKLRYIPSALLGDIEIRIKLKPLDRVFDVTDSVVALTAISYTNIRLLLPAVQFENSAYEQMLQARMDKAPLEIQFKNYSSANATGGASTAYMTNITTSSLDRVYLVQRASTYNDANKVYAAQAVASGTEDRPTKHYHFVYASGESRRIEIGGVQYPQANVSSSRDAVLVTLDATDQLKVSGTGNSLETLTEFETYKGVMAVSFCMPDSNVASGLNTMGATSAMNVVYSSSTASTTASIVFELTSTLRV